MEGQGGGKPQGVAGPPPKKKVLYRITVQKSLRNTL
jgi:hypothetical protein